MLNQVKEMGLEKGYPAITPIPWPRVGTCTLPLAFLPSTVLQKINKQLSHAPEIYQHCRQFFSCKARTLSTPPPPPAFMGLSCQLRISYFVPASHFHYFGLIIKPLLTKLFWSRWLDISFILFVWDSVCFMNLYFISVHKNGKLTKNLAKYPTILTLNLVNDRYVDQQRLTKVIKYHLMWTSLKVWKSQIIFTLTNLKQIL